jgi:hypothetical protein
MRPDPDHAPATGRLPRRTTDRVEDAVAWFLTAAALLLVVVAGVTGLAVQGSEAERAELQSGSRSPARAVLLEEAHVATGDFARPAPMPAMARWTDRDGRQHVGLVPMTRPAPAGTELEVWIDAAGEITSRPVRPENAVAAGIASAFGVLCAGGTLLGATWLGVRRVTLLRNARRWEREWARVEPQWRRTVL